MFVNIAAYHFTPVEDPAPLAARLRELAGSRDLRGTVLVAGEGLNLFLAGTAAAIDGFVEALREDARFAGIGVKYSHSRTQPFARLKVKLKREIIAFRRDDASPLLGRAPALAPTDLARWLDQGHDDAGRPVVMLDTRNREEVGHGSFAGALTLPIDNFTDLPDALEPHREALADATVVSFCTGGIRCEKAALWMRATGMDNVLQLDGGILGYFEQVGGAHYDGRCFVFDERVALDPALRPLVDGGDVGSGNNGAGPEAPGNGRQAA
ncbi:sulfurtransferase [Marilutibacter chinensis]|uniref:tRNA uridine(34) hydroxylase n=1 Tax=Marilutibacter chinensis TaxID=2912247 RepID=A0ABS9HR15_9GAMM|nr:sulfurtransferase [Lysobacter chinensis]MCF7220669.1 sulfurtransferase [Lysobacter chinensis]